MRLRLRRSAPLVLMISALLAVAACTGTGGVAPTSSAPPSKAAPSLSPGTPSPAPGSSATSPTSSEPTVILDQAWATGELIDVATGEPFRIADHAGKVIIVETMAIWCKNCLQQQNDVQAALARLPAGRVVFIVLDIDPNEDASSLAAYRERHGFEGRYAVASTDVARALSAEFGDQFLNPPSTPMLLIGTDGAVTRTDFGHKSPDVIVALAEANGA